ncbi:MAG: HDOD domain-containing protein, partial [Bdellovibrionales bacterium]|nr:HDOD domain-containing protein [Bdellovibrionales bacterium]
IARVVGMVDSPQTSSRQLGEEIAKDQVLTAKVLKLINSPYYGIPGEVTDVQRALAYLGFNTLAQLILSVSVISMFQNPGNTGFSLYEFWKHALGTAVASETIAKRIKYPRPEECFTCGLLHDIGKLVLLQVSPEDFVKVVQAAERERISFTAAEKKLEVPPHGYLGEYIANKWRLPQVIRVSIRYHHFDVRDMGTILDSMKPAVQIVSLANQLVIRESIGSSGDMSGGHVGEDLLQPLGLGAQEIPEIAEKVKTEMDNVTAFLRSAA